MARARSRTRLSREDWIEAALQALADGGPREVAVERLAARLGATKGSFYWHFADREELISEALATWEREATDALPSASDPVVGDVVRRVQHKRLDFLTEVFRDAGFPPAESRLRARLAYSLYLGWFMQRLVEGSERATPRERAAYQRRAIEILTARS